MPNIRVEVLTVARAELESRCANLMAELREQAASHEATVSQLQHQLSTAQEELARLRLQNQNLRTLQVSLESANNEQQLEINDLRARYASLESDAKSWQTELQLALAARAKLQDRLQRVERRYQVLRDAREREYDTVMENTLTTVREQFLSMRIGLNIGVDEVAAEEDALAWSQRSSPAKPSPRRQQPPPQQSSSNSSHHPLNNSSTGRTSSSITN